jgi:hypothetical protein
MRGMFMRDSPFRSAPGLRVLNAGVSFAGTTWEESASWLYAAHSLGVAHHAEMPATSLVRSATSRSVSHNS